MSCLLPGQLYESGVPPRLDADEKQEASAPPVSFIPYQLSTDVRWLAVGFGYFIRLSGLHKQMWSSLSLTTYGQNQALLLVGV